MFRFTKLSLLFCSLLSFALSTYAQEDEGIIPESMILNQRWSYNEYTHLVVPTINWLQNTPIDTNTNLRKRHDNFVMYWLQKNEDVVVNMPEYLLRFQNASRELYFIYSGGWIKHALVTGDHSQKGCAMAAVKSVLDFYKDDMGVPQDDYLDNLLKIEQQGKLPTLFDSTAGAQHTYLFLQAPTEQHDFEADENYFNFRYTGINFTNTRALRYRYKLEGYYDKWVTTKEETVTFAKLPSGSYNFVVQASIYPEFAHAVEQQYSFTIATPLYRQTWFIIAVIALCIAGAYLYMRKREQRLKHIAKLQQEKINFEYEYLKSQVNPHFLFNSLNTLTSLIEDDKEKATEYTSHLSDLYRNMLAHPDRNLVPLKDELDVLHNYIHIQRSRFGDALQVNENINNDIKNNKRIVYLALQLLVENAIKHNIVSASKPLVITIAADGNELTVSNPIQLKPNGTDSNGMGLANIQKRYALNTTRQVTFGEHDGKYVVRLPLL